LFISIALIVTPIAFNAIGNKINAVCPFQAGNDRETMVEWAGIEAIVIVTDLGGNMELPPKY